MRCNCENLRCSHGEKACLREANPDYLVRYIGEVCPSCFEAFPEEYRLAPKEGMAFCDLCQHPIPAHQTEAEHYSLCDYAEGSE
jgi:hypothetical protein